jgi:hypothetical protein
MRFEPMNSVIVHSPGTRTFDRRWQPRSPERMSDGVWQATLSRVRGEFDEMPCIRVTGEQARVLLGLAAPASEWVLSRLVSEGFLERTAQGEYVRSGHGP